MAGFDAGSAKPAPGRKLGGLHAIKRRLGVRIDMTPMVDIVFLLLIFYMVTTVFSTPQAMEINLPAKPAAVPYPESRTLIVRVDGQGDLYTSIGHLVPEATSRKALADVLRQKNRSVAELVTVVTIHPDAKYDALVDILDDIDAVEHDIQRTDPTWSYRFSIKPWDRDDDRAIAKAHRKVTAET